MQELIEAVNEHYSNSLRTDIFDTNPFLEKEKKQIINTYEIGSSHGMGVIEDGLDYIHGIEYFEQTYNQ